MLLKPLWIMYLFEYCQILNTVLHDIIVVFSFWIRRHCFYQMKYDGIINKILCCIITYYYCYIVYYIRVPVLFDKKSVPSITPSSAIYTVHSLWKKLKTYFEGIIMFCLSTVCTLYIYMCYNIESNIDTINPGEWDLPLLIYTSQALI